MAMVGFPERCFSVDGYPEQDLKRLPWQMTRPCRYGWNCWRPGCAFVHDQARDRHEHVRNLAEFWTAALKKSDREFDIDAWSSTSDDCANNVCTSDRLCGTVPMTECATPAATYAASARLLLAAHTLSAVTTCTDHGTQTSESLGNQLQIIENIVKTPEFQCVRGTRTPERSGTAPGRLVVSSEIVGKVVVEPPLAALSVPAMCATTPVEDPVIEFAAPAPAATYAEKAPAVEYIATAPAVTYTDQAPVVEYTATAPVVTYEEEAPVVEYIATVAAATYEQKRLLLSNTLLQCPPRPTNRRLLLSNTLLQFPP